MCRRRRSRVSLGLTSRHCAIHVHMGRRRHSRASLGLHITTPLVAAPHLLPFPACCDGYSGGSLYVAVTALRLVDVPAGHVYTVYVYPLSPCAWWPTAATSAAHDGRACRCGGDPPWPVLFCVDVGTAVARWKRSRCQNPVRELVVVRATAGAPAGVCHVVGRGRRSAGHIRDAEGLRFGDLAGARLARAAAAGRAIGGRPGDRRGGRRRRRRRRQRLRRRRWRRWWRLGKRVVGGGGRGGAAKEGRMRSNVFGGAGCAGGGVGGTAHAFPQASHSIHSTYFISEEQDKRSTRTLLPVGTASCWAGEVASLAPLSRP